MRLYNSLEEIAMLTIRGADQVCTSLRAARKSLGDGKSTSISRIEELDLLIGELAVGSKSYVGDPVKSKQEIESFIALLSQPSAPDGAGGEVKSETLPPGVDAALAHFRRAVATLQRIMTTEAPVLQSS